MLIKKRPFKDGFMTIQLLGLVMLSLIMSGLAIDFAFLYAAQNHLQTAADSAALAATQELYSSIAVDPDDRLADAKDAAADFVDSNEDGLSLASDDVVFGYVNPTTKKYDRLNFKTPTLDPSYTATNGYNAVYVRVRKSEGSANSPLRTIMANLLGISHMNAEAESVALLDQGITSISNGGVRPIYACQAQFNRTMQDGIPQNDVVRVYGQHVEVNGVQNEAGCPTMGSGNWGFADLRNCNSNAVGSSTISDWFRSGFPGTVRAGQCYSTNPGNFIPSIADELDDLIANQVVFPVPLYNSWSGGGSTSQVNVSGFVGFRITGYKSNGNASGRYIEGYFTRYLCNTGCTSTSVPGVTPGGAVVKIRLAYRS